MEATRRAMQRKGQCNEKGKAARTATNTTRRDQRQRQCREREDGRVALAEWSKTRKWGRFIARTWLEAPEGVVGRRCRHLTAGLVFRRHRYVQARRAWLQWAG
jgi:hypothetical protein